MRLIACPKCGSSDYAYLRDAPDGLVYRCLRCGLIFEEKLV